MFNIFNNTVYHTIHRFLALHLRAGMHHMWGTKTFSDHGIIPYQAIALAFALPFALPAAFGFGGSSVAHRFFWERNMWDMMHKDHPKIALLVSWQDSYL